MSCLFSDRRSFNFNVSRQASRAHRGNISVSSSAPPYGTRQHNRLYRRPLCSEPTDIYKGREVQHTKRHTLPYLCPVDGCLRSVPGTGFYQTRDRDKHRDSHSAAASFRCPVEGCGGTATRDYNMVRHVKDQHKIKIKKADLHASAIVRSRRQR
ncbi:hypothetical protein B0T24DRAFT_391979 [Lasiosphaeria ovina]|uniref:C2H2-type domain-containing protein n=1 Tax=Lasiosphaeria ovina TaxID=92902 RepID=A0AAE0JWX5_9PEZI|nr:hypothetical protein B0T24DRAFT_391979 [Lasiosphaeria ovina]